jgi:hypothetical protein
VSAASEGRRRPGPAPHAAGCATAGIASGRATIRSLRRPLGTCHSMDWPTESPSSALPMGASTEMQPEVTFRSDRFNTSQPREHFINPECFGDDLAAWLIQELRERGVDVDAQPGQEDFGWYVRYRVGSASYCFVLGLVPGDDTEEACWAGWSERDTGFLAALLGGRHRGIVPAAVQPVKDVLASSAVVRDVQWLA